MKKYLLKTEYGKKSYLKLKTKYTDSGISIRILLLESSYSRRTIADSIIKFSTQEQVDLIIVVRNVGLDGISN